VQNIEFIL